MSRAILTGLGGVICDFDSSKQISNFSRLCRHLDPFVIDHALCHKEGLALREKLELGLRVSEFKELLERLMGLDKPLDDEQFRRAYVDRLVPNQDMLCLWGSFKAKHPEIKLIGVTDMDHPTLSHFLELCYLDFDQVLFCGMFGVKKSDPDFYRETVEFLDLDPQECLFVDDRPANITAAFRANVPSTLFRAPLTLMNAMRSHLLPSPF
jgi:FMN phosphatase YigB (HAD superfamily)